MYSCLLMSCTSSLFAILICMINYYQQKIAMVLTGAENSFIDVLVQGQVKTKNLGLLALNCKILAQIFM